MNFPTTTKTTTILHDTWEFKRQSETFLYWQYRCDNLCYHWQWSTIYRNFFSLIWK